jgi:3-hydroxyacyl-[acyl-carrier-protein] dehydratase
MMNPLRKDMKPMGFTELKPWLRHTHPMVLLDRVVDHEPGEFLTALVAVSGALDSIAGHFPERAIYPGSSLIQAFAQTGIILCQLTTKRLEEDELTLVSAVQARFFAPAVPGDRIELHNRLVRTDRNIFWFDGIAIVDGNRIAAFRLTLVRTNTKHVGVVLW